MKTLSQRLDEYLALRRALGFNLSFEERVLRKFTIYGDENGHKWITTTLFLDWKDNYGNADNNTWSYRLGMVRDYERMGRDMELGGDIYTIETAHDEVHVFWAH